ncbi:hypothetical protein RRG08_051296 [Elysia crispata]|uniref:Uncharacterized protein n=1 Tax=Elysia crispata TaxID=231223 RepID=A0AAE0XS29_9GAST|nr:hypothetical protein RRG08_051296 [Elysia crispata]
MIVIAYDRRPHEGLIELLEECYWSFHIELLFLDKHLHGELLGHLFNRKCRDISSKLLDELMFSFLILTPLTDTRTTTTTTSPTTKDDTTEATTDTSDSTRRLDKWVIPVILAVNIILLVVMVVVLCVICRK